MRNLIWYLLLGTRGGPTRASMLVSLKARPKNLNQLSLELKLDYKTIQHHVRVLEENRIIFAVKRGTYGAVYFIDYDLDKNWKEYGEIWKQFGKK